MQTNNDYLQLIQDIKLKIAHSRYIAARVANQEQLKLYMSIGALIDTKMREQNGVLMSFLRLSILLNKHGVSSLCGTPNPGSD